MERTSDFRRLTRTEASGPLIPSPFAVACFEILKNVETGRKELVDRRLEYLDSFFEDTQCSLEESILSLAKVCSSSLKALEKTIVCTFPSEHDLVQFNHGIVAFLYERLSMLSEEMSLLKQSRSQIQQHARNVFNPVSEEAFEGMIIPDIISADDEFGIAEAERSLSSGQLQELQEENEDWIQVLEADLDAARSTETKVLEVSELVSMFSQKVLEQQEAIDSIHSQTLRSRENVEAGNKQLEKALAYQSDRRILMLTFLVVASFSLLFLDWIQD